jgi:hypothetical protein
MSIKGDIGVEICYYLNTAPYTQHKLPEGCPGSDKTKRDRPGFLR